MVTVFYINYLSLAATLLQNRKTWDLNTKDLSNETIQLKTTSSLLTEWSVIQVKAWIANKKCVIQAISRATYQLQNLWKSDSRISNVCQVK